MSTSTRARVSRGDDPVASSARPAVTTSRWASWRLAAKLARHDARRNKYRMALAVLLIVLPLTVLMDGLGTQAMFEQGRQLSIERAYGGGQGSVTWATDQDDTLQGPDGARVSPTSPFADQTPVVSGVVGHTLIPVSYRYREFQGRDIHIVEVNEHEELKPRFTLTEGRWPSTSTEALVTVSGVQAGLPQTGTVDTTTYDGSPETLTIVGRGTALADHSDPPDLVTGLDLTAQRHTLPPTWIIVDDTTVTAADADRAAEHGITMEVVHPLQGWGEDPRNLQSFWPFIGVMALLWLPIMLMVSVVGLISAPAFTVAAEDARHDTSILLANGAGTSLVKRRATCQGLIVGGTAVALSVAVTLCYLVWTYTHTDPSTLRYGHKAWDVPWVSFSAVAGGILFGCVRAARWSIPRYGKPATSPPAVPSVRTTTWQISACAAAIAGSAACGFVAFQRGGLLHLVSLLLLALGIWAGAAGLLGAVHRSGGALTTRHRMALRTIVRGGDRTYSVVSSVGILAGLAVLAAVVVPSAALSTALSGEPGSGPGTRPGESIVWVHQDGATQRDVDAALAAHIPGGKAAPIYALGTSEDSSAPPAARRVVAVPMAEIDRRFDLTDEQRDAVRGGTALARRMTEPGTPVRIPVAGDVRVDTVDAGYQGVTGAFPGSDAHLVLAKEAVDAGGWPARLVGYTVYVPGGSVDDTQFTTFSNAISSSGYTHGDQGSSPGTEWFLGVIMIAIVVVSVLMSTRQIRRHHEVMLQLGASPAWARVQAGAHGAWLGGLGVVLGVAATVVVVVADVAAITMRTGFSSAHGVLLDGHWIPLAVSLVATPVVAGLVAASVVPTRVGRRVDNTAANRLRRTRGQSATVQHIEGTP